MSAPRCFHLSRPAHARARRGFTLVEVAAALALLAISAAIVIPQIGQLTGAYVESQARQFLGAIEYANTQAVTRRNYYRLYFNLDKHTYWLEGRTTKGKFVKLKNDLLAGERPLEDGVEFKDLFIIDKTYKTGITYIEFLPDGSMDPALIHLQSLNEDEFTVQIDPFISGGTVEPGYVEPKDYPHAAGDFSERKLAR